MGAPQPKTYRFFNTFRAFENVTWCMFCVANTSILWLFNTNGRDKQTVTMISNQWWSMIRSYGRWVMVRIFAIIMFMPFQLFKVESEREGVQIKMVNTCIHQYCSQNHQETIPAVPNEKKWLIFNNVTYSYQQTPGTDLLQGQCWHYWASFSDGSPTSIQNLVDSLCAPGCITHPQVQLEGRITLYYSDRYDSPIPRRRNKWFGNYVKNR